MATKQPGSATTAAGNPCKAWAVRGTDPPLCSAHAGRNRACPEQGRRGAGAPPGNQNRCTHGYYAPILAQEFADFIDAGQELSLEEEIVCARILLRRLVTYLGPDPDNSPSLNQQHRATDLALQATRTIARLLRDQRAGAGDRTTCRPTPHHPCDSPSPTLPLLGCPLAPTML
jgi:hypothetical protein